MHKPSDIAKLYEKYNVRASKRFGQNFLVDQNILKNIINVADIKNKDVIEIGPGLGSLTMCLLKEASSVTSYEIDNDMIRVLKGEITDVNFTLINGDFLNQSLEYNGKKTLVANIPYNITSDIIFKLFKNSNKIDRAIIMVQKEVAMRLIAKIGAKDYGKLTITAKHFADIKYNFTVPQNAFIPAPKIESAIITFDFKDTDFENSREFLQFVKQCFAMRRKTLFNNLKNFLGPEISATLISKLGKGNSVRPQELSYSEFLDLFEIKNNIV